MIISKEIRENPRSPIGKELCISYVNKDGGIDFFQHILTEKDWFEWQETVESNCQQEVYVDRNTDQPILDENGQYIFKKWRSYDGKPVAPKSIGIKSKYMSNSRISEILNSYGNRIDHIFEMNRPKLCYCDIETLVTETSGFPKAEDATQEIATISVTDFPKTIIWAWKNLSQEDINWIQQQIDEYSETHSSDPSKKDITKGYKFEFRYFSTEKEMMLDFLTFINQYTAVAGWNFLQYDWKYIHNRCLKLGIDIKYISPTKTTKKFNLVPRSGGQKISLDLPLHKIIFDYMLIIKTWDQTIEYPENHTLDYIAKRVLGIKKVNHPWGFAEFYKNHFKEYVFYNAIDTILIDQIDKAIETASIWFMLASILRIDLNAAYSTITPVETVMANYIYPDYKVFANANKNKDDDEEENVEEGYDGAFVWPTRPAMNKLVMGLDFASLYPTIMRQFGISPEVFLEKNPNKKPAEDEVMTCTGAIYKKDKNAIIPAILTDYFGRRKQAKANKKQAESELEYYKKIYHKRLEDAKRIANS